MRSAFLFSITILVLLAAPTRANAQADIISIVKDATVKVIKAVDLKIQRLQNKTIWLQNAQRTVENVLSKAKLAEIGGWVDKQKTLYAGYFDELKKVKAAITTYHRVRKIIEMQARMVREYQSAFALFKKDRHFTPDEMDYIGQVYAGILDQSVKNMDQVQLVITALLTQMGDGKRLALINEASKQAEKNYSDLQAFTNQNKVLSLERSTDENDLNLIKQMYGIE